MIVFITGPSSCGKSRLIDSFRKKNTNKFLHFFSADTFYKQVSINLREEQKHQLDWSDFHVLVQEEGYKKWISRLNELGKDQLVIVDDITTNLAGYLHEITCPYRIFLLAVPLGRFFLNIKRRKDRKGGQVLKEIMECYEPSPYPTSILFEKEELIKFSSLTGYSQYGVKSMINKCNRYFFQDKNYVHVRVSLTIPLPVTQLVSPKDAFKKLKKITRNF